MKEDHNRWDFDKNDIISSQIAIFKSVKSIKENVSKENMIIWLFVQC